MQKSFAALLVTVCLLGCQEQTKQTENYRLKSLEDLTLKSTNHPHGFGRADCFLCHQADRIHKVDRLGAPSFDLADQLVKSKGLASCTGCHGKNGVNP